MTTALIETPISTPGLTDLAPAIDREHQLAMAAACTAAEHGLRFEPTEAA